ncbi:MAG: SP0191 family lipoprotein [Streptococcus sp.]
MNRGSAKAIERIFNKDDAFKEAFSARFTADLTLENENEYKVTITYDFEAMDVKKAEGMTYFKNNHLPELLKLTPSQFADNLINAGASEQK